MKYLVLLFACTCWAQTYNFDYLAQDRDYFAREKRKAAIAAHKKRALEAFLNQKDKYEAEKIRVREDFLNQKFVHRGPAAVGESGEYSDAEYEHDLKRQARFKQKVDSRRRYLNTVEAQEFARQKFLLEHPPY